MKIHSLSIENTKRVRAVSLTPEPNGLTVIGGDNGQGKTSVLDAIAWALGGEKYRPSSAHRDGSVLPPMIRVTFDSGIVVERKGKNSALTVTDSTGRKAGQQLLNEFISELAIDLPRFMNASDKEKAQTLLAIIGVGDELKQLDARETDLYNQRRAVGRILDQKRAFMESLPYYPDAPNALLSPMDLIRRQQEILARNAENERRRRERDRLLEERHRIAEQLNELTRKYEQLCDACMIAEKSAEDLQDESTAELEASIATMEETNRKVRANLDKEKAEEDGRECSRQYNEMTAQIDAIRKKRQALLDNAELPLPGLSVEDGCLTYMGKRWDCMSGSQQLKAATSIVGRLKPHCGFVLLDKLEQMDVQTLSEFGQWLAENGLQAIATRVSTGEECTIIIEDGAVAVAEHAAPTEKKAWKSAGSFGGFARKESQ